MRKPTRLILWIVGVLLVCIVLVIAFFLYDQNAGFGAPAHPAFTGYTPTELPSGIHVIGQTLTRYHQAGLDIWYFVYAIKLSNPAFTFSNQQTDDSEPSVISCRGIGDTCNTYTASNGIVYRVEYAEFKGQPFDLQVGWINGRSQSLLAVSGSAAANYIKYNWGALVSSGQPVDLSHMSFTKRTEGGSGG